MSKLDKLDDLEVFKELQGRGDKAFKRIHRDFDNLNFSMIYFNKTANEVLASHLESVSEELKETK